jgi:hypothetical protein
LRREKRVSRESIERQYREGEGERERGREKERERESR